MTYSKIWKKAFVIWIAIGIGVTGYFFIFPVEDTHTERWEHNGKIFSNVVTVTEPIDKVSLLITIVGAVLIGGFGLLADKKELSKIMIAMEIHAWYGFEWFGIRVTDWGIMLAAGFGTYYAIKGYFKLIKDDAKQQERIIQQQYESIFYNLVKIHYEILNNLYYITEGLYENDGDTIREPEIYKGKEFLDLLRNYIEQEFAISCVGVYKDPEKVKELATKVTKAVFKVHSNQTDSYINNIYAIFGTVERMGHIDDLKTFYADIFRNQLSQTDRFLLQNHNLINSNEEQKRLYELFKVGGNYIEFDEVIRRRKLIDKIDVDA